MENEVGRATPSDDGSPERVSAAEWEFRSGPQSIVVVVRGELDLSSAEQFEAALVRAAERSGVVVADLAHLDFIDSSGLRALVRADALIRQSGGRFVVACPRGRIRKTLELTGLDRRLDLTDTEA